MVLENADVWRNTPAEKVTLEYHGNSNWEPQESQDYVLRLTLGERKYWQKTLQKRGHSKTSIVKMQISKQWCKLSVNQEIPCVYSFPGYCSCSDSCNICLFFNEE